MENIVARPNSEMPEAAPINATITGTTLLTPSKQEEAPFSVFAKENQMPYTAQYFGMDKQGYDELSQADIGNMTPKIEAIENYVLDKILFEEYFDSTQTFNEVMQNIKEMLGIKEFEPAKAQIDKIFSYVNAGKSFKGEFHVQRTSKAAELDHARYQRIQEQKQTPSFRRMDNLFNKFFNK